MTKRKSTRASEDAAPKKAASAKVTGWSQEVDLEDALNGDPPPGPEICRWVDDGASRALFYPNEIHSVFGEPESMKSWLVLHAAAQEVARGQHVFFLDLEANDRSVVQRMRVLGAKTEDLRKLFHYHRPDEAITRDDQDAVAELVSDLEPSLVVIDGVTEGLALHNLSPTAGDDIAMWFLHIARRFIAHPTDDYAGPAIVEIDHVVKDRESRGGWAIGSVHKKAGIKGAAYQVVVQQPFGKGRHGLSRVFLEKDSPGGVEWTPFGRDRRRLVAELHAESGDSGDVIAYLSPAMVPEHEAPSEVPLAESPAFKLLQRRVWEFVDGDPGCSVRAVRTNVTGTGEKVAAALETLEASGHLRNDGIGTRREWVTVKPFDAHRVKRKKPKSKSKAKPARHARKTRST